MCWSISSTGMRSWETPEPSSPEETLENNTLFAALEKILSAKETKYVGAAAAVALAMASAVTIVQRR